MLGIVKINDWQPAKEACLLPEPNLHVTDALGVQQKPTNEFHFRGRFPPPISLHFFAFAYHNPLEELQNDNSIVIPVSAIIAHRPKGKELIFSLYHSSILESC